MAWRQTAEFVSRFLTKGRLAIVEGKLQTRDYTDRDGNRRYATEVVADNVYFGDSRRAITVILRDVAARLRECQGGGYN